MIIPARFAKAVPNAPEQYAILAALVQTAPRSSAMIAATPVLIALTNRNSARAATGAVNVTAQRHAPDAMTTARNATMNSVQTVITVLTAPILSAANAAMRASIALMTPNSVSVADVAVNATEILHVPDAVKRAANVKQEISAANVSTVKTAEK